MYSIDTIQRPLIFVLKLTAVTVRRWSKSFGFGEKHYSVVILSTQTQHIHSLCSLFAAVWFGHTYWPSSGRRNTGTGKKVPPERPRLHNQSAKNTLDIIPERGVIKTLLLNVPMPSDPVSQVVIKKCRTYCNA